MVSAILSTTAWDGYASPRLRKQEKEERSRYLKVLVLGGLQEEAVGERGRATKRRGRKYVSVFVGCSGSSYLNGNCRMWRTARLAVLTAPWSLMGIPAHLPRLTLSSVCSWRRVEQQYNKKGLGTRSWPVTLSRTCGQSPTTLWIPRYVNNPLSAPSPSRRI